jgi:hypothetical protein
VPPKLKSPKRTSRLPEVPAFLNVQCASTVVVTASPLRGRAVVNGAARQAASPPWRASIPDAKQGQHVCRRASPITLTVIGFPACTVAESYHCNHLGQISHGGARGVKPPARQAARCKPPCRFKPAHSCRTYSEPNDVRSVGDTFNIHRTLPIDNNSARYPGSPATRTSRPASC